MDNIKYKNTEKVFYHYLAAPFTLLMVFPLVILDFFIEIYHNICFRLCDIPMVDRGAYIRIDRHKLEYLSITDKANCAYCGYANGILGYATEIAARTEKYWCGIKHKTDDRYVEPRHHQEFLEYGDRDAFVNLEKKSKRDEQKATS